MSTDTIGKQIAAFNAAFSLSFDADSTLNLWLINQVSEYLDRNGVSSLADLAPKYDYENPPEIISYNGNEGQLISLDVPGTYRAYCINKLTGKIVPSANPAFTYRDYYKMPITVSDPFLVFWNESHTWDVYLDFNKSGFPIFYTRKYKNDGGITVESFIKDALANFAPIAPIVLGVANLVIPGLGLVIGQAIGAAIGVADAVFCQCLGNFALSLAGSGGNVENAVKNMAIAYVSSGISQNVAGLTNSAFLGNVTAATVKAAIAGKNVNEAALFAVLGNVGTTSNTGVIKMEPTEIGATYDDSGNETVQMSDGSFVLNNIDGSSYYVAPDGTTVDYYTGELLYSPNSVDYSNTDYTSPNTDTQTPATIPTAGMNVTFNDILKAIPQVAQVWRSVANPAPVRATRTTTANGSIVTPNKNGTITSVTAQGKTSVTRMPAGTPYYFEDGSYSIVDANGRVTNVAANGSVTTSQASGAAAGGSGSGALAAMAIGLMLISN